MIPSNPSPSQRTVAFSRMTRDFRGCVFSGHLDFNFWTCRAVEMVEMERERGVETARVRVQERPGSDKEPSKAPEKQSSFN